MEQNSLLHRVVKKQYVLLLEVLIAFTLVALCALPLIYPHVYLLSEQKRFVNTVELDHLVNLMYVELLEKFYNNEIAWNDIIEMRSFPIDTAFIARIRGKDTVKSFPYVGSYQLKEIKHKKNEEKYAALISLTFVFTPESNYFNKNIPAEKKT